VTGIVIGLVAAFFHSLAYLATRWYTVDRKRPTTQLLVLAHVIMGVVAAAVLPVLWPVGLELDRRWLLPAAGMVGFFVPAQLCLIWALRHVDASRIAPLLALKLAMLAVIAVAWGETLTLWQWGAVVLAVLSAWVLNGVGGRLPWKASLLVVAACAGYALADSCIVWVVDSGRALSGEPSTLKLSWWTAAVAYAGLGLVALPLLPWCGSRDAGAWRDALPYAGSWMAAMVCLYVTFADLGTVFGSILQSTRGLMSIGLGVMLAAMGWHHLEQKHGWDVVMRRLGATAMMCVAVWLYTWKFQ
jgi:hypothetical protein